MSEKNTLTLTDLARMQHMLTREVGRIFGEEMILPDWEDAEPWMIASSQRRALSMLVQPDLTAEGEHDRWRREREAQGWQLGEFRDNERRLHPSIRPFAELPAGEQVKDVAVVALTNELRQFIDLSGLVA